ncbi:MAG: secretin N-terminal domain-containing protein, partial [Verrucomicrobiota bacterium]
HTTRTTPNALPSAQLPTLPPPPFRYQLKYLRPSDIEQIKLILQPFLTPGSGIIEYETKTNTLIVMDNERKLDALSIFLEQIDQPKQQIAIETRILRITSSSRNRIGVDWSSVLGEQGLDLGATASLNSLFNLPELETVDRVLTSVSSGNNLQIVENNRVFSESITATTNSNESNLVLSPLEVNAVLRALNAGGLAQQESSPTLIAEDNEEGLISIIDRIPIITATVSETTAGQNVSEEVRYVIDQADPVGDPSTTREIGVSVAVTPTILPDDTIRMALRPRSAQVVEFIEGQTGNVYPRVNESTVTTTARVPNGHSLLIGGFYEETQSDQTNKVPVLGDLPALNLLFKSTDKQKEHTSLVFIVTPRLYRPNVPGENDRISHEIHDSHILPADHDYPDPQHPGHSYHSDLRNTTNNIFNKYEPDAPSNLLHPAHPYNAPESLPVHGKDETEEPYFESPSVTVRAVDQTERKGGFFGKVFGGNKANRTR